MSSGIPAVFLPTDSGSVASGSSPRDRRPDPGWTATRRQFRPGTVLVQLQKAASGRRARHFELRKCQLGHYRRIERLVAGDLGGLGLKTPKGIAWVYEWLWHGSQRDLLEFNCIYGCKYCWRNPFMLSEDLYLVCFREGR